MCELTGSRRASVDLPLIAGRAAPLYERKRSQTSVFSKRLLGVWQFLNLARFAKIAQKSYATCGMVSSYATNDVKL